MTGIQKYYRSFPAPVGKCSCGILNPEFTDVEKVEDGEVKCWYPLVNEPPIFFRSHEKVLCFAKTPGGAIIGSVTGEGGFSGGNRCICETTQTPDTDISHSLCGDFAILEEVRFHNPVKTQKTGEFYIDAKLLAKIEHVYNYPRFECVGFKDGKPIWEDTGDVWLNEDALIRTRNQINRSGKIQ